MEEANKNSNLKGIADGNYGTMGYSMLGDPISHIGIPSILCFETSSLLIYLGGRG